MAKKYLIFYQIMHKHFSSYSKRLQRVEGSWQWQVYSSHYGLWHLVVYGSGAVKSAPPSEATRLLLLGDSCDLYFWRPSCGGRRFLEATTTDAMTAVSTSTGGRGHYRGWLLG